MTDENVTPINGPRKAKKPPLAPQSDRVTKIKIADIYRMLSNAIRRVDFSTLPPFPQRYEVIEPERGARIPVVVGRDGAVVVTRIESIQSDLVTYCEKELGDLPDFSLGQRQIVEAVKYYILAAAPVLQEAIKVVSWQGEPGLTYRRLPWEKKTGGAPTWETLLGRMSNAYAFIEWIGSLFFEESYLQNYVWLYGRLGGDGKGAINRFLEKVFGSSYRSKQSPGSGQTRDKFWTYGLLGARLVVFPDCDDPVFVTKGLFKSLTGGDPTDVEAKGAMSFTVRLKAKFLIISNDWPALSLSPSDLRRIIYCELGPATGIDPQFENCLWEEGGAFLTACVNRYLERYPHHGPISTEGGAIEGLAATVEEDFDEVFQSWFELDPDAWVPAHYMLDVVSSEWVRDRKQQHLFRRWLERRHGVRKKKIRDGKELAWGYAGIRICRIPPERGPQASYREQLNNVPQTIPTIND